MHVKDQSDDNLLHGLSLDSTPFVLCSYRRSTQLYMNIAATVVCVCVCVCKYAELVYAVEDSASGRNDVANN